MGELCPCDVNTHSTAVMLRGLYSIPEFKDLLKSNDIIHLGAHDGIERDIYNHFEARNVYWFECNKFVFPDLLQRIGGHPGHKAFLAALWSEAGVELEFHFYRDKKDGAGGFFEDKLMKNYIKDCPMLEETIKIKTTTLDKYVEDGILDISNVSFLNIDLQGAELEAFKGAQKLLNSPKLKAIWCEVSWDEVYDGGPQLNDITNYLKNYDFMFAGKRVDWAIHGDALYVR